MLVTDKVAVIVPIPHLHLIKDHMRFMALTHILDKSAEYAAFYREQVKLGKWVILDNSTVELGTPEPIDIYLEKALELQASEILLPDFLHNSLATLREADRGLNAVSLYGYKGQVMGVPQGGTPDEWLQCFRDMIHMGISSIGVSRRYLGMFGSSRLFACYAAYQESDPMVQRLSIHLLGAGAPLPEEVAPCMQLPWVSGVDSALPSYMTRQGYLLEEHSERPSGMKFDFEFELLDEALLQQNIHRFKRLSTDTRIGDE